MRRDKTIGVLLFNLKKLQNLTNIPLDKIFRSAINL
jgi:hypothetical protein